MPKAWPEVCPKRAPRVRRVWRRSRIEKAKGGLMLPPTDEHDQGDYVLVCGFGRVGQVHFRVHFRIHVKGEFRVRWGILHGTH